MTFKKGDEVLVKGTILSFEEGEIPELEIATSENTFFVNSEDIQVLPKKVVIPNFVAKWITKKKNESKTMHEAIAYEVKADVFAYLVDNSENFARAWLDGYEMEQKQLYTVEIPNPNNTSKNVLALQKLYLAPYYRQWMQDGERVIDYGSHRNFYYIVFEEDADD